MQDGEAAYRSALELLRHSTRHNLFDVCGLKANAPFQIDGNLGGPAGLAEMLLQSHSGTIRLLPALPKAWPAGSFRGLRARGGVEVDCLWRNGKIMNVALRAGLTGTVMLAAPAGQRVVRVTHTGRHLPLRRASADEVEMHLQAGGTYSVEFA